MSSKTLAFTNQELLDDLQNQFSGQIQSVEEPYGLLTIQTSKDVVISMLSYLKKHSLFQFIFLTDLTAVHYPQQENNEIGVVYHLHSWAHNFRFRIKVFVSSSDPVMPTATVVYRTANWMERETYDNMGVIFVGHPDLRRILNIDEMDYFPLRKEYPLEDQLREDKVDHMFGR